ncbi:MAG: hypothetical protein ACI8ZM_000248 [Crocinitomix sp.]|jgi:hypothetical protein
MNSIKVTLKQLTDFTKGKDVVKAQRIQKLIEFVANHPTFHEKILDAEFKDRRFVKENGEVVKMDDNQAILDIILSGKEQYVTEDADKEWDLRISLYRSFTFEIGYRSKERIFTKKKKFRKLSDRYIAAHWIHEYMHVLRFTHDHKRTDRRPDSVPYLIGEIAEEILKSK